MLTLLLAIPYFGMFAVRSAANFPIFIGAHIGLAAWPLFLPVIWTPREMIAEQLQNAPLSSMLAGIPQDQIAPLRVCWFILLVIAAIRSISSRLRARHSYEAGYLVFCIGLLAILSLISGYFNMRAVTAINAVWAFTLIAGYLVYNQTIRIDESLDILSVAGKKPVSAILRFNNSILAMFLIPVVLFASISPWLPLDRAARLFGVAALAAIRGLFRFIGWLMSLFQSEQPAEIAEDAPPEQDMGGMLEEASETPAWLALLEIIINTLMQILVVGLIAAAIAYGAYKLYKRFLATRGSGGKDDEQGDTSEYIGPKIAAKPIAEALGNLLRRLSPKSESEKIRRIYYKKVRRHIKRGADIKRVDTTGVIAEKLRPAENIDELTAQYERARYGDLTD